MHFLKREHERIKRSNKINDLKKTLLTGSGAASALLLSVLKIRTGCSKFS